MKKRFLLPIYVFLSSLLAGCGGGNSTAPPPPGVIIVNLTPDSAQAVDVNQSDSFMANGACELWEES